MTNPQEQAAMPQGISLDQITLAYVHGLRTGQPLKQPVFEAIMNIDGKWLRVSYHLTHQWLDRVPDEIMEILPTDGAH